MTPQQSVALFVSVVVQHVSESERRLVSQSLLQFPVIGGAGNTTQSTIGGAGLSRQSTRAATSRPSSEGGVLVVAEKPSVAKAQAHHLSNGRMRTASNADGLAPMCKLHHFHHYFPPAKGMLPVVVTSVTGHLFSLDFDEAANRGAGAADPGGTLCLFTTTRTQILSMPSA